MKSKKILSFVTALAMTLSMFVISVNAESIYTEENGWILGGAIEQSDGTLKLGKGASGAATFTPDLEHGKLYEITYDVTGLEVVSGSWTKPFTVTLSAGGQTEKNVLTYRMAGAWRDITTDQKYVVGSNGQNKIIIDTKTGEWEAYALGTKATYSGHTSSANSKTRTYNKFSDTSDFTISFYAYDNKDGYTAASISNVKVAQISSGISISATAEGNGTVTGSGIYDVGESVTLMATPVVAGTFLGWYDGDTKVSDKANYTFTVTESKTYVARFSTDTKEYETLILACTDFQNQTSSEEGAKTVTSIVNSIKRSGFEGADAFFCCGDYSNSYNTTSENLPYLKNAIIDFVPDETSHIYVQGNHDSPIGTEGLSQSGDNDPESGEYGVFVINEDDYMWYNSDKTRIAQTAGKLADYLNEKLEENYKEPIFVLSHIPLYKSLRTTDSGDAQHANQLFYVLNQAGEKGLNIIFMAGHDHSGGYESYLGGSAVYLTKGDHINIPQGSTTEFKEETLNFSYMNAGYVGYYASGSGRDSTLNMTLFGIDEETDSVDVYRYDANGIHNLKSAGVLKSGEVNSGEYKADTKVYSSPQTIKLTDVKYDNDIKTLYHTVTINVVGSGVVTGEDIYITDDKATLTATPNYGYRFEGWYEGDVKLSGDTTYNLNVTDSREFIAKFEQSEPNLLYTGEKGWILGGAVEQQNGTLKIAKGADNAAEFTPVLEYGKKYEITYDVTGLEVVSGSWKKPFTVTLSAGGQTEKSVLTYRMAGAWRDITTDEGYVTGSNGQNKIIIDTKTGEWEAYALGTKATYSGYTSNFNSKTKTYNKIKDMSDFKISFYAYDTDDEFVTPYISNVKVTVIGGEESEETEKEEVKFEQGVISRFDRANGTVRITGSLENAISDQYVTVLAVPGGTDIKNINLKDAHYIRQIKLDGNSFDIQFKFSKKPGEVVDIYLGGTDIYEPVKTNVEPEFQYVLVDSLNISDDNITATAYMKNFTDAEKKATMIVTQYSDEGTLLNVNIEEKVIPGNTEAPVQYTVSSENLHEDTAYVRAMVWDGTALMTPLIMPVEKKISNDLKVLAIGNSFSSDSVEYLYQIAKDAGMEDVKIGNLYIGGCSLENHWNNALNNRSSYTYYKNTTGTLTASTSSIYKALKDEDWDVIVLQQVSGLSGQPETYEPYLTNLEKYLNEHKTNPEAKLAWNMTWAYQGNSTHQDFPRYDNNQITMYNAICDSVQSKISNNSDFSCVIPAGTAIQNMRTSYIGDNLTRDGYHLSIPMGRYIAALTWFKALTHKPIDNIQYTPDGLDKNDLNAIKEAVNNACKKPFDITVSSYPGNEID